MPTKEEEKMVEKVLTDKRLHAIKSMLEKDHAIDCLFLLLLEKGRWKEAKAYTRRLGLTLSDGTFRARMIEIESIGLAKSTPIDPLKKYYTITPKGKKLASSILQLLHEPE